MTDRDAVPDGLFAGRYRIERELGRGGAAVVYLARDERQDREIALKILHPELAQALGAQRFLREIKHSSSLHHPHLLAIHESGEFDGRLYYVMPYMPVGSLRTRLAREKQLPIDEAVRITRDLATAIAYAHSKGVVHRDIKPDNVLFSESHVCLADFGVARAIDAAAPDTITSTGLVVGTPAYMSPEQASGDRNVDARTDQYSLACVMFEMVTGLPPFMGVTAQSVIAQRFTQAPPSMRAHRPMVPDHVERAVRRALALLPVDRFPGVKQFSEALGDADAHPAVSMHSVRRGWFAAGAAAAIVTVAVIAAKPAYERAVGIFGAQLDSSKYVVLPFLSSGDSALGDRASSGVYSALRRWEGLSLEKELTVRDAIMRRGGRVSRLKDAIAVARDVGAGRLIWGSVTAEGQGTTVVADMYDVSSSAGLGEERYAAATGLEESGLRNLANSLLSVEPLPAGFDDGFSGTTSYQAWRAYRRGIAALAAGSLADAKSGLHAATEADHAFAVAQLWLARVAGWLSPPGDDGWVQHASRAVAGASELRPRDVTRSEALLAFGLKEYDRACASYSALVRSDTLDAHAWYGLAECLHSDQVVVRGGRSRSGWRFRTSWHASGEAFRRALALDPRLHAVPRFDWVSRVLAIHRNKMRPGQIDARHPMGFAAVPLLVDDTIAYTPYPLPDYEQENDSLALSRRMQAYARNMNVLLPIAVSWTRNFPRDYHAHAALASILEARSELTGPHGGRGALESIRVALALAPADAKPALLDSETRLLLKLRMYPAARLLADSALRELGAPTKENWRTVAHLAPVTGSASLFGAALQHVWVGHVNITGLDPTVERAGGDFLAYASLAICSPATEQLQRRLEGLIDTHVQPERQADVRERVTGFGLSYLAVCTRGLSMAGSVRDHSLVTRAQNAFARGRLATVRGILDTLWSNRSTMRSGDMALNLSYREAWLRAAMGDTARATRILDHALEAFDSQSESILQHPLEYAMLMRIMIMRSDFAALAGDRATARKWAAPVAELWRNAEAPLQTTAQRMGRVARSGS